MSPAHTSFSGNLGDGNGAAPSAAALFAIVWDALADMLGTAAVAAILRRAAARAVPRSPELADLVIVREDHQYRYTLPLRWSVVAERGGPLAFRELVLEIGELLQELTGTVVISRLEQLPGLVGFGLVWRARDPN